MPPPAPDARAYRVSNPDPDREARFAAALEDLAGVGVPDVNAAVAEWVSRVIELADEFAIAVVHLARRAGARGDRRARTARARQVTYLTASLHNHGVTATTRNGQVRLSVHAATTEETLEMLRAAFVSYGTAASY